MNEKNREEILEYLNNLHPKGLLEVSKAKADIEAVAEAIGSLTERINAPRQNKLLEEEVERLKIETQQLAQQLAEMKAIDNTYETLMKNKESLLKEKKAIENVVQEQEELQKIKAFVERYDLSQLKQVLGQLQSETGDEVLRLLQFFEAANQTFSALSVEFAREVNEALSVIEHNRNELKTKTNGTAKDIRLENIHFSNLFEFSTTELYEAQGQYNDLATQLNEIKVKLHEIKESHFKNVQIYHLHFAQNQEIWGALGKRHHLDQHLNTLVSGLENGLKKFDEEVKGMVEKADKIPVN